jgi:phosphoglycerate dehydrogenase-like enzyme
MLPQRRLAIGSLLNSHQHDIAMGPTIASLRRIRLGDRYVRRGSWVKGALPLAQEVGGKNMGILGYSRSGQDPDRVKAEAARKLTGLLAYLKQQGLAAVLRTATRLFRADPAMRGHRGSKRLIRMLCAG